MNRSTSADLPEPAAFLADEALRMFVCLRFRCDSTLQTALLEDLRQVLDLLAPRPGFVNGHIAVAVDDPELVALTMEWLDVGSYRRAWSDLDIKVAVVPVLSRAIDEPNAFEVIEARGVNPVAVKTSRQIT